MNAAPWTVDYSDTGAGLPWEVRFDYLKNNGWTTSEILRLQAQEMQGTGETIVQCPRCEGEGWVNEGSDYPPEKDLWQCLLCLGEGEIEKGVLQEYQQNPEKYMKELEDIAKEQYYQTLERQKEQGKNE